MRSRYLLSTFCSALVLVALSAVPASGQLRTAARALNAPNRVARQAAVTAVSAANPSALVDMAVESTKFVLDLVDLRGGGDKELAGLADEALIKMAPEAAKRLADAPDESKVELLDVLETMGDAARPALGEIVDQLDDENPIVREEAADALGEIANEEDDEVISALEKATSDTAEAVADSARRSLRMLRR